MLLYVGLMALHCVIMIVPGFSDVCVWLSYDVSASCYVCVGMVSYVSAFYVVCVRSSNVCVWLSYVFVWISYECVLVSYDMVRLSNVICMVFV